MNGESFLDRIPCGILKLNTQEPFAILYCNQAIKTWFHSPVSLRDLVSGPEYTALVKGIQCHLSSGLNRFLLEFKTDSENNCIWFSIEINYVSEENILYCAVSDITTIKKAQERLRLKEEQHRLAAQHFSCLVSVYDIPSGTISPTPEFSRNFPLPFAQPLSPESLIDNGIVHKESIVDFLDFFHSIEEGKPEGKCILRLKAGGKFRWFSTHYSLVYTENQTPVRSIISYQDITDEYEKELAYQRWRDYMEEQKKDCIGYYEYNLKYDLFEEIIGEQTSNLPKYASNSFSDIICFTAERFIYDEDRKMYLQFFNKEQLLSHYYKGHRSLRLEHRRLRPDGSFFWALGMVQIVSDPYTDTIKAFILIKDIDASKREALTLQELSEQDSLTGLLNRATAIRSIRHALKNRQSHHVLIILDIDRFKQLNDSYGHQFGDKALHRAASRLKSALRRDDIFGRLGGDEFIILLKDVSYSMDLYTRLENLCNLIGSALEPEAHISGSLGTAAFPEDGTSFEELYEKADIALYQAKKHGRNQYTVYEPGMRM
ncbi:diguanylate cyclase domain-containing protein [Lacrimispora sp. JR3]|uniref:diguanylate cyclase domain-containing protein n=1 Tax=Lacrimispora sinapis TaxID=3111456 RepID=UPI0037493D07